MVIVCDFEEGGIFGAGGADGDTDDEKELAGAAAKNLLCVAPSSISLAGSIGADDGLEAEDGPKAFCSWVLLFNPDESSSFLLFHD